MLVLASSVFIEPTDRPARCLIGLSVDIWGSMSMKPKSCMIWDFMHNTDLITIIRLLQDFYFQEASNKPRSIHATYLITGERELITSAYHERQGHDDNIDTHVESSPLMSSPMPVENKPESRTVCVVVTLAREENLDSRFTFLDKQRDAGRSNLPAE